MNASTTTRRSVRKSAQSSQRTSPALMMPEMLEGRRMFSTYLNPNGQLSISGTQYADLITVNSNGSTVTVTEQISGQAPRTTPFQAIKVTYLSIASLEGSDWVTNNTGVLSYIDAGPGNDIVDGGSRSDIILGRDGNDSLSGRGGDDNIDAAAGDNAVYGGDGNDTLVSWHGKDVMVGGAGNDYLRSYAGDDLLYGGDGNDSLIAGAGNDKLYGENGTDWMWGEEGDDYFVGGTDTAPDGYIGGAGNDKFATHWVWYGGGTGWRNVSQVYDFQSYNYGWGLDAWVNPS